MVVSKTESKFIISYVILFGLLMCFSLINNKALIPFIISSLVLFDILLKIVFGFKIELRILFYLLVFLILLQFIYQQNTNWNTIQQISRLAENAVLFSIVGFMLIKNKNWFSKEFKILTIILIMLIICNFISTMLTYQNLKIFISTTIYYCKYFSILYFIMLSKFDDKDIIKLLKLFSVFIVICTALAILQFVGIHQLFDLFRGRFQIISRNGYYRSIGFFSYPIELGNFSAIIFCLYYFLNKYKYKSTWFNFISLLAVINIVLSGTRIALVSVVLVLIFSSLKSIKQIISTTLIIVIALFISNNFINISKTIEGTTQEYQGMSPRQYYIQKGIDVWKDNAFVGIGFATYGSMQYRLQTDDKIFNKYNIHDFDFANLKTTDTFIAEILPEFGILGVLSLFLFSRLIYKRYKILEKQDKSNRAYIYIFFTLCILSLNSCSIFFSSHVGSFFWISMGMILNNYYLLSKNVKQQQIVT